MRPAFALAALLLLALPVRAETGSKTMTLEELRSYLAPVGAWIEESAVGPAWRPNPLIVGKDFRPYATRGHWAWIDEAWSFESDFAWGWATFHYGRWAHDEAWGWVWTPGTEWAPAHVEWRVGGGCVGWAPRTPEGWRPGVGVEPWVFVETRDFLHREVWEHLVPPARARELVSLAEPLRTGPAVRDIEEATGLALRARPDAVQPAKADAAPPRIVEAVAVPTAKVPVKKPGKKKRPAR